MTVTKLGSILQTAVKVSGPLYRTGEYWEEAEKKKTEEKKVKSEENRYIKRKKH